MSFLVFILLNEMVDIHVLDNVGYKRKRIDRERGREREKIGKVKLSSNTSEGKFIVKLTCFS